MSAPGGPGVPHSRPPVPSTRNIPTLYALPDSAWRRHMTRGGLLRETLLAWLVALPVLALAWQTPGPLIVDIGPPDAIYLTGWDVPEVRDGHHYRWSTGPASLHLPGLGVRSWRVTLVAAAGRRPPDPRFG